MRVFQQAVVFAAVCATGIHAGLLTPVYPAPRYLSTRESHLSSSWRNVTATFDKLLFSKSNATAQSAALKNLTFSVGMFSVRDSNASSLQYHHTSPEVANSSMGVHKVDGDSIYNIASATKVFTVLTGLLELKPEDWERPLTDVFPEFADFIQEKGDSLNPATNVQWDKVTVSALAAQIGGIPRGSIPYTPLDILLNYLVAQNSSSVTPDVNPVTYGLPPVDPTDPSVIPTCAATEDLCDGNEFAESIADNYPVFQPWASPSYANNGFILLGQAIVNLTGKSLDQLYQESIFDPLGMESSRSSPPEESDYSKYVILGDPALSVAQDGGIATSSGGLLSSTNDLAKFGVALLNSTLLSAEETRRWMKPKSHTSHLRYSVGAPWEIYRYTHTSGVVTDIYTKSGDSGYYSSYLVLLPDFDAGFSIITCSTQASRTFSTAAVADVVTEAVLPELMNQVVLEAQDNFAGTYVSSREDLNSSITLSVQKSPTEAPGLGLSSWISNGTDVLPHLSGLGISARSKFVPTIPLSGETGQVAFRPYGAPGAQFNWSLPAPEALPVLDHCYRQGLNFFDTANVYSGGDSEVILGRALKEFNWRRENIVIATKVWAPVGRNGEKPLSMTEEERDNAGYVNQYGLSRKHIFESVDASLQRLGLPYVDLLQIHRFDPHTPPKETMEALHDVVKAGKVRYIGASSMFAHQLLEYQYTARLHGWTEFISIQNLYNAIYREEEREMFPACAKFGMGSIPWSPVAMGFLTRPWKAFRETSRGDALGDGFMGAPFTDTDRKISEKIEEIANARGVSMATVSIAWCLSKPFITAPIVGMSKIERVDEAVKAIDFELTAEEVQSIDELYEPKRIIGHR
ncbi:NADP-dependent oxidoreductase domain-containing protein [Aspergillus ambiguus]|uniref:NADP-dependent oxidoreductase domain-containing protein n=1 Tax=Aspergillus ambiguus TaxID=176160 RepID=UPI003CCD5FB9